LWVIVASFFYVFFWGLFNKKSKILICDVLNISSCMGAVAAARLIGLRRVGIMTDMPGLMVDRSEKRMRTKRVGFNAKMNKSFLRHFTHYVFLTEQMNKVVNVKHRPYIVMEGLVDAHMTLLTNNEKESKRIVIYAGGLHERYGLKLLVEGFIQADIDNTELWLYGDGPFVEEISSYAQKDLRIVYKGIRPNDEVVDAELKATLLVNPRPTHEEFTQYSFPSKNMEYMVSGTPVLTTILPGMPVEYHPHVYLFDRGETVEGYAEVLRKVLNHSTDELKAKGAEARRWVLENKNNINQAKRIIELIKQ
jgi:glycosyltransferase involved in cell wall biosynthesis